MKNNKKGKITRPEARERERASLLRSYLLELEELLLDLDPLGRRLVRLAPDELEHLVAAAADGALGRMHHVGR